MARRKSKSTRRSSSRGLLGGAKGLLGKALLGLGAASVGSLVASRFGINPLLSSGIVGFLAGGPIGAISSIALPMVANQFGGNTSSQGAVGTVWA